MPPDQDSLIIERITVKEDRMVCEVKVPDPAKRQTTPHLWQSLQAEFPDLPSHTCKNSKGTTFAAVMESTSLPHFFEHLVVDLQTRASTDISKVFVGTTEWVCGEEGKARVEVSFADDLNALQAFRDAAQILNKAML